jgi:polyisoprenoid-binding protein YceI
MPMIRTNHSRRVPFCILQFAACAALGALLLAPKAQAQVSVVQIDPGHAKIEFSLGGTMHTVHGTFALKSSTIRFDPSTGKMEGAIAVDAASGDSGNGSRDSRMHREILESSKFTEIVFLPEHMSGNLAAEGASKLQVSGRFRLHGLEHEVTLPVDVKAEGGNLEITAHLDIPYVQWGLKNPSNFFLRVSEVVGIEIHAQGRLQPGDAPHL